MVQFDDCESVHTACDTEGDEFEYWCYKCEELLMLGMYKQISHREYVKRATHFDTIPGVGEYYRWLCESIPPVIQLTRLTK